jgi:hypothetical protein
MRRIGWTVTPASLSSMARLQELRSLAADATSAARQLLEESYKKLVNADACARAQVMAMARR